MRIAVVVCVYPPYRGGIGHAAQRQAAILRDLGHEVVVHCPATEGARPGPDEVDGIPVVRHRPLLAYGNSALVPQLAAHTARADALFLHYPFFGGAEAAVLGALARRRPYVAFFHMDVFGEGARGAFLRAYQRTVGPLLLRGARRVLVSSRDYFDNSLQAGRVRRVEPAPYGVDTRLYAPGEVGAAERRRLGIEGTGPLLLFVGGMDAPHAFKGVPELLEAVAAARRGGSDARLSLVGDGALRAGFEERARRLGLRDAVRFHGRVDEDHLIALDQAADIAVLPSTSAEEAFGLVLIEAMACRTAVIASDLPGVRDVVGRGDAAAGLLVPPGDVPALADAIARLAADDPRRGALAARGLERVRERYSREAERATLARVVDRDLRCVSRRA